jgi:small-conductance mechanosensitive channel
MSPSVLESVKAEPIWLVLTAYTLLAATVAIVVGNLVKGSLQEVAKRAPSHLGEVIAASVPKPLGAAVFLAEMSAGLRWLPVPEPLEILTRHFIPFCLAILAAVLLMRVAQRAIEAYGRSNPALRSSAGIGQAVTWVLGLSVIALLASDAVGVSLAPVLTALGIGSLAVALALQDTLSNFFSGINLLGDKPFRPGDFLRLEGGGQEGYVESIGWRSTHLRTLTNGVVIIPNAVLAKSVLTNFGATNPRLVLRVRVDVSPGSPVDAVEAALASEAIACTDVAGMRADPAPSVLFLPGCGWRGLGFTVVSYLEPSADADVVEHHIRKRLYARLLREGVAMPRASPVRGLGDKPPS